MRPDYILNMYKGKVVDFLQEGGRTVCKSVFSVFTSSHSLWKRVASSFVPFLLFFLLLLQFSDSQLVKSTATSVGEESTLQEYSAKRELQENAVCIREMLVSFPLAHNDNLSSSLKIPIRQPHIGAFKAISSAVDTQLQITFKNLRKIKASIVKIIPHHIDYYIFSLCKITT